MTRNHRNVSANEEARAALLPEIQEASAIPVDVDVALLEQTLEVTHLDRDQDDLPNVSWENATEREGSSHTEIGFAKLVPGWAFRGYILEETLAASDLGNVLVPMRDEGGKPMKNHLGEVVMQKMQKIFRLKGTVRMPMKGVEGGMPEVSGVVRMPAYARLAEAAGSVMAKERRATEKARAKDTTAGAVKIPVEITYIGQQPDVVDDKGEKKRSGAQQFRVVELQMAR